LSCPSRANPLEKCGGIKSINVVLTACVGINDYNACMFELNSKRKTNKAKKAKKLRFQKTKSLISNIIKT